MEWNKAKDIIIFFLVLLNIMLGVLLGINSRKYVSSIEQEKNIVEVLASNNISMYCKIINQYKPMKMLEFNGQIIDENKMVEAFLGTSNVIAGKEGDIKSYDHEGKSLLIFENKVIFENLNESEEIDLTNAQALKLCNEYLSGMGSMGTGYELDLGPYMREGELILEYRQKINGNVIYDNYFIFVVDNYGIRCVDYSNNMPIGYSAGAKEICSSDEALFSFLQAMKRESAQRPQRIVEKMDIVYFIDPAESDTIRAYPYYRIYYTEVGDPDNLVRLCMVNAYLNTWRLM